MTRTLARTHRSAASGSVLARSLNPTPGVASGSVPRNRTAAGRAVRGRACRSRSGPTSCARGATSARAGSRRCPSRSGQGSSTRDDVEVVYRSFQLDPSAPRASRTGDASPSTSARKYGGGAEAGAADGRAHRGRRGRGGTASSTTGTRPAREHRRRPPAAAPRPRRGRAGAAGPAQAGSCSRRTSRRARERRRPRRPARRAVAEKVGLGPERVAAVLGGRRVRRRRSSATAGRPPPSARPACRSSSSTAGSASPGRNRSRCSRQVLEIAPGPRPPGGDLTRSSRGGPGVLSDDRGSGPHLWTRRTILWTSTRTVCGGHADARRTSA